MKISCPQCGFSKDINKERLPMDTVVAHCPKCAHSFRIYKKDGRIEDISQPGARPSLIPGGPDDPLPPGAVIPGAESAARQTPKPAPEARNGADAPKAADDDVEELRRNAMDAYRRQAQIPGSVAEGEGEAFALDNPWENGQGHGRLDDFYQTCVRVMFSAPRFFSGLAPDSSRGKAFVYFLLITVIQIVVERLWGGVFISIFNTAAANDPQLHRLLQMLAPDASMALLLISRAAWGSLQLFFITAVFFLSFRLFIGPKADFSLVFLVLAYSEAPIMLCIVPIIGSIAGYIWSLACGFVGCRYALRLTWGQTAAAMVPVYIIGLLMVLYLGNILQATMSMG